MKILETERLYLRRMTVDDAENAYQLNLDPNVIRYTGDEPFESVEHARIFLNNYTHYEHYDFGRWAVIQKKDEAFLGWCGLKYTPEQDEFDIGFRFFKKYWNQGFATEAAKACINLGFNKYQMTEIVGRAMKENKGSIRVLQKTGLTFLKEYELHTETGVIYHIQFNAK